MMRIIFIFLFLPVIACPLSYAKSKLPTLVLDPDGGGSYAGFQTPLFVEKDATLAMAKTLQKKLQGVMPAVLTRNQDYPLEVKQRISIVNGFKDAIWISLHFASRKDRSQVTLYTLQKLESSRQETFHFLPVEKAQNPWIAKSNQLAQNLCAQLNPILQCQHIRSAIPVSALLGVNHPGIMAEIEIGPEISNTSAFQNLMDELATRIASTVFQSLPRKVAP